MNLDLLRKTLDPWLRVSTWHTFHPSDDTRFNLALAEAFKQLGHSIAASDIEDAIVEASLKSDPKWTDKHRAEVASRFAAKVEDIASFIADTGYRPGG